MIRAQRSVGSPTGSAASGSVALGACFSSRSFAGGGRATSSLSAVDRVGYAYRRWWHEPLPPLAPMDNTWYERAVPTEGFATMPNDENLDTHPSGPTHIAHFRIVSRLGQGGMGVVYRAEDESLRREVALKLLGDRSHHPETRQRFLREARSAAAVSHPNVAVIHQVGEADGQVYIAMELVEGETLRGRLSRGRLEEPIVLELARQVASGLAAAHLKGIVHRDLKPENVMVTPSGLVKLLDFGLAKVGFESESTPATPGGLEKTATKVTSDPGAIMGTPEYMSPEQATGEPVDVRSDVFSFGIMLYEMLAGSRPFVGSNSISLLVAIARDPAPALRNRAPTVDASLDAIVARCLAKAPAERYAHAGEVVAALSSRHASTTAAASPWVARAGVRLEPRRSIAVAILATLVVAAGVRVIYLRSSGASSDGTAKVGSPASLTGHGYVEQRPWLNDDDVVRLRLSPDAKRLAYTVAENGHRAAYFQLIGGSTREKIPAPPNGDWGDIGGFFPDGELLMRRRPPADQELWKVSPDGRASQLAARVPRSPWFVRLSPDGTRLLVGCFALLSQCDDGLYTVPLAGGPPTRLTDQPVLTAAWSPRGDQVAYATADFSKENSASIDIVQLDGTRRQRVLTDQPAINEALMSFAWPEPRQLVVWLKRGKRGGALVEVPLDDVGASSGAPRDLFAWPDSEVSQFSMEGGMVAFAKMTTERELLTTELGREPTPMTVLTSDEARDATVGWLDDRRVGFFSSREGGSALYAKATADGPVELVEPDVSGGQVLSGGAVLAWRDLADDAGASCALIRVEDGGAHSLFTLRTADPERVACDSEFRCGPSPGGQRCVGLETSHDGSSAWWTFDPSTGRKGPALYSTKQNVSDWDISPSGDQLTFSGADPFVNFVSLSSGVLHQARISPPLSTNMFCRFTPDGKQVFLSGADLPSGSTPADPTLVVAASDLEGHAQILETMNGDGNFGIPLVSPNGKRLAIPRYRQHSRLWLLKPQ